MTTEATIFADTWAEHTPFGVTWSSRAYIADLTGGHHFEAERHGHPTATSAARAARAGTATLWRVFCATNDVTLDRDLPRGASAERVAHGWADENGDYI
jgi:hypothetical protein